MATDLRRWILIATLGSAAIAIGYLPLEPREPRESPTIQSPARRWESRTATALAGATYRVRWADRRDYLRQQMAMHAKAPNGFTVVYRNPITPNADRSIRANLDSVKRRIVPAGLQVPVIVVIDDGTAGAPMWIFPSAANPTCGVSSTTSGLELPVEDELIEWRGTALSRCAYYAAFGMPGPAIRQWLESRAYDMTRSLAWTADTTSSQHESAARGMDLGIRFTANLFYLSIFAGMGQLDELACAQGDRQRCLALALEKPPEGFRPVRLRFARIADVYGPTATEFEAGTFLADLVRAMGRERFAQFWRSPLPVEAAFSGAFGMDLAQWTEDYYQNRMLVIPDKTAMRVSTALEGLLAVGVAFAVAAAIAERRQVA